MSPTRLQHLTPPRLCIKWIAWAYALCLSALIAEGSARPLEDLSEEEAPYLSRPEGIINQLRWINQGLRQRTLRLDLKAPLNRDESSALLQRSQLALAGGEERELIFDLRAQLQRAGWDSDPSYPLLLVNLARAERQQGLELSAERHIQEGLTAGLMSSQRYESTLLAHLELSTPSPRILEAYWETYQQLSARAKRPLSEELRYRVAKALYQAGALKSASTLLEPLETGRRFKYRARFIKSLIALKSGDLEAAATALSALDEQLTKARRFRLRREESSAGQGTYKTYKERNAGLWPPPMRVSAQSYRVKIECRVAPDEPDRCREGARGSLDRGVADEQLKAELAQQYRGLSPELIETLARAERELQEEARYRSERSRRGAPLPPNELGDVLDHVGAALKISRGRLALIKGDYDRAWNLYRGVPLGTAWGDEARLEAVYLLRSRGAYDHGLRLLDQVLKSRVIDAASFKLSLWQLEMLYKAQDPESARDLLGALKAELEITARAVKTSAQGDDLFPSEVLDWLDDQDAQRISRMVTQLEGLKLELMSSQEMMSSLLQARGSAEIPSIAEVQLFIKNRSASLNRLKRQLPSLERPWRRWNQLRRGGLLGLPKRALNTSQLTQSVARLEGRLEQLSRLSQARERVIQRALPTWLRELSAELQRNTKAFNQLSGAIKRLSVLLKAEAIRRVDAALARLTLIPTEASYWAKERESDRMNEMFDARRAELKPLGELSAQNDSSRARLSLPLELLPFSRAQAESSPSAEAPTPSAELADEPQPGQAEGTEPEPAIQNEGEREGESDDVGELELDELE